MSAGWTANSRIITRELDISETSVLGNIKRKVLSIPHTTAPGKKRTLFLKGAKLINHEQRN